MSCCFSIFFAFLLSWLGAVEPPALEEQLRIFLDRPATVISRMPGRLPDSGHVLVVDADRNILGLDFTSAGPSMQFGVRSVIGQDKTREAREIAGPLLRKDEVVSELRGVSCTGKERRVWVLLAWRLDADAILNPVVRLLILAPENTRQKSLVSLDLGIEVDQFLVQDINADRRTEVAVVAHGGGRAAWVRLWQVNRDCQVQAIPTDNIQGNIIKFHSLDGNLYGITATEPDEAPKSEADRVREYDWDPSARRFVLSATWLRKEQVLEHKRFDQE